VSGVSDSQAERQRVSATREFFGPRAAGWEERFPDDGPRYERAVADLAPPQGAAVLDAGCGTGRALPYLAPAVGSAGVVVGLDLTPEMVAVARQRYAFAASGLVVGDVLRMPFADGAFDAVFAAGLISHLPEPAAGLREICRVCRPGARLALFHPIGRAALGRRHGRELSDADVRAESNLRELLDRCGWNCDQVDDAEERYLALATRR
jgi:SAM-dependent methyltransferase